MDFRAAESRQSCRERLVQASSGAGNRAGAGV